MQLLPEEQMACRGTTRLIDTPDGPVRQYYPTVAEQREQMRRERERNLRWSAEQRDRSRPEGAAATA